MLLHFACVCVAIAGGVNLGCVTVVQDGTTPLWVAVSGKHCPCVKVLLGAGANANVVVVGVLLDCFDDGVGDCCTPPAW